MNRPLRGLSALAFILALAAPAPAHAQRKPVFQDGVILPNHLPKVTTDGLIKDSGSPAIGDALGKGISPIGITDKLSPLGVCSYSDDPTKIGSYMCLGHSSAGVPTISIGSVAGAGPQGCKIDVNGVVIDCAGGVASLAAITPTGGTVASTAADLFSRTLSVVDFGVVADGVTSADVAFAAAVAQCNGKQLLLPPGKILLTGAASIALKECNLVGQGGVMGGAAISPYPSTTILLTSTSVKPFIVGRNWSVKGVNFFWPNQATGTTVYPALFSDDGVNEAGPFELNGVDIVNAYDGLAATGAITWNAGFVTNSRMYAVHDLFRIASNGDTIIISNSLFNPGTWLAYCSFTCNTPINAGAAVNAMFRIPSGLGTGMTYLVSGLQAFGWRYGVKIESGGGLYNGPWDIQWDGVGTFLDSAAGGITDNITFRCGGCTAGIAVWTGGSVDLTGTAPAFNLGGVANSRLMLRDFTIGQAQGSGIFTAGTSVYLDNSRFTGLGRGGGAGEHYAVAVSANNGTDLVVRNGYFNSCGTTKCHGIYKHVAINSTMLQGNLFSNLNDAIDLTLNDTGSVQVTGNASTLTVGTASTLITGSGKLIYANNDFDKPPTATVSACGAGATVNGAFAGFVQVGSTNPTTSCALTLPFTQKNGICTFTVSNFGAGAFAVTTNSLTPPTWTVTSTASMHDAQLFFSCPAGL